MIIKHELKMDLGRRRVMPRLSVVQDDKYSRDLVISLYNADTPWEPGAGTSAVIQYVKPDQTCGSYDILPDGTLAWTIEGNVLTAALAPQVCTVVGPVKLAVRLVKNEAVVSTFTIGIDVQPLPGLSVNSADYYKLSGTVPLTGWTPDMYLGTDGNGNVVVLDPPQCDKVALDITLTEEGQAAEAKAVGERFGRTICVPAAAQVGQYLRVKEVDASGKVTAVEAVSLDMGDPAAYLYNGVELPPLPVWDKAAYPYAYIVKHKTNDDYRLYIDADPEIATAAATATVLAYDLAYKLVDNQWVEDSHGIIGYVFVWANHNIYFIDSENAGELAGTLHLEASDPVPVYANTGETDSGTGGLPVFTLTTAFTLGDEGLADLSPEECAVLSALAAERRVFYGDIPIAANSNTPAGRMALVFQYSETEFGIAYSASALYCEIMVTILIATENQSDWVILGATTNNFLSI